MGSTPRRRRAGAAVPSLRSLEPRSPLAKAEHVPPLPRPAAAPWSHCPAAYRLQVALSGANLPWSAAPPPAGVPAGVGCRSYKLPEALAPGARATLEAEALFTHVLRPEPAKIRQSEPQRVVYQDSALLASPYRVEKQSTEVGARLVPRLRTRVEGRAPGPSRCPARPRCQARTAPPHAPLPAAPPPAHAGRDGHQRRALLHRRAALQEERQLPAVRPLPGHPALHAQAHQRCAPQQPPGTGPGSVPPQLVSWRSSPAPCAPSLALHPHMPHPCTPPRSAL